jgi:hypothetical protein
MDVLNVLEKFRGYQLVKSTYEPVDIKYRLIIWYDSGGNLPASFTVWGNSPKSVTENALIEYENRTGKNLLK